MHLKKKKNLKKNNLEVVNFEYFFRGKTTSDTKKFYFSLTRGNPVMLTKSNTTFSITLRKV